MLSENRSSPTDMGVSPADVESNELVEKELRGLGLEAKPEHLRAIAEMRETSNFPEGYEDIVSKLGSPDELKAAMEARGIKSIVHAEGVTVWDHTRAVEREINELSLDDVQKRDLRLIILYHDLGKVEAARRPENVERTKKHLEKGALHTAMVGHEKAKLDEMRKGLMSEGVDGRRLEQFMMVITNHMNTSMLEQDPKKTFVLIEAMGETDEERRAILELLAAALYVDGSATQKVELVDGELKYSKNEKKVSSNVNKFWEKYEEGRRQIEVEQQAAEKKKKAEELEFLVLGMKLSDYIKQKGVKPGPEMGKALASIKGIMENNKDKTPTEIRELVEQQFNK